MPTPAQPSVALATCAELPQLDRDDRLLLAALAGRGIAAVPAVWDDLGVPWESFDLVLVRNTWDYSARRDAFLAWVESLESVLNPAPVIRWNTDKRYLTDLAAAGIPVVQTSFLAPGAAFSPPRGPYVVKPTVSAGTRHTARYGPREERQAAAHVLRLHAEDHTVMVQPYLETVDERGETALLFFEGAFSHAIGKGPVLRSGMAAQGGRLRAEDIRARQATAAERELAERVTAWVARRHGSLLYSRVDLVEDGSGGVRVLELELTEPSLFMGLAPGSAERLSDCVAVRVDGLAG
jgi:glutathione synthase/RimK-type ligase-like ATP-grasp enzyme